MSNKLYDLLNNIVRLGLPALGTLYATLAAVWSLPFREEVVSTILAFALFLGVVLKIASARYIPESEGSVVLSNDPNGVPTLVGLNIDYDATTLADRKTVYLEVNNLEKTVPEGQGTLL